MGDGFTDANRGTPIFDFAFDEAVEKIEKGWAEAIAVHQKRLHEMDALKAQILKMEGQQDQWEEREATAYHLLRNLLAVIHRDGGHHTSDVGLKQSVKDAQAKVIRWIREVED